MMLTFSYIILYSGQFLNKINTSPETIVEDSFELSVVNNLITANIRCKQPVKLTLYPPSVFTLQDK